MLSLQMLKGVCSFAGLKKWSSVDSGEMASGLGAVFVITVLDHFWLRLSTS